MPARSSDVPVYRRSVYSRSAILDPYPHYQALRALGPVVWLPRQRVYALPRYAECKAALRNDALYKSGHGVAINPPTNRLSRGTTLNSDGAEHDRRRKLLAHRMMPRALRALADNVDQRARDIVERAVRRGNVDAVPDLATALPLAFVPDLVGWPHDQRDHLLDWAAATFDVLGPINWQAAKAVPRSLQMLRFARRIAARRDVLPDSMAHDLLSFVDEGALGMEEVAPLLIDYLGPSLDTTISAIASAIHLLATHPDQWAMLKADPALIPNAVNEVVRFESPLRAFTRKVAHSHAVAGVRLPAGARVLLIYASANRDEREWNAPDVFDIRNDAGRHIGFGNGAHACAGQGLARLETAAILTALLDLVDRIEVTGEPTWAVNNIIRRHRHLPVRLVPA
ncbi:cytochrome P450 [Mycolicibacter hiberniae]|uniref:Cytochrome P450 n=1 Tax=Mycolicibacter hiberniae TaxID=29314 RepID=A0A7I7X6M5_9MYCO|nr:cytochrome P450 [Mycolicibacter hiberniae]MCV7088276.1 cytochrome P450 [Mycolicibacter hiberniae]ORV68877.1 monooxygenase [Mycolicibacter hiberniae]BBZ25132.1 cytochrome P450 [Mycolicibacter hiberniae]